MLTTLISWRWLWSSAIDIWFSSKYFKDYKDVNEPKPVKVPKTREEYILINECQSSYVFYWHSYTRYSCLRYLI
jgi:hypothetical protein